MKRLLIIFMACVFALNVVSYSDDTVAVSSESVKLTKAQRKAQEKRNKEIMDSLVHESAVAALKDGHYVLMAERLMIKGRAFLNPTPNTNFILVQGDNAVIQLASNRGNAGLNGMGGITVQGKITGLKGGEPDKKGRISYSFSVTGPAISAQVHITLYKDSNKADAIVSPNFWSGNLNVYGQLVPYDTTDYNKAIKGITFP